MKLTTAFASLALSYVQAAPPAEPGSGTAAVGYQTMGTFMEKNFDWANFDQEVTNAVVNGYNYLYLGFYMALHGCQGACTAWRDLSPSTKQSSRLLGTRGCLSCTFRWRPGRVYRGNHSRWTDSTIRTRGSPVRLGQQLQCHRFFDRVVWIFDAAIRLGAQWQ